MSPEVRENEGLATLGLLQQLLADQEIQKCVLDVGIVRWGDPLPLLFVGLILAESGLDRNQVLLDLGRSDNTDIRHRIFLKFLAQQGLLTALSEHAQIRCDGQLQENVADLRLHLANQPQATHFQNADCIFARLIRVDDMKELHLQQRAEELVTEARTRATNNAFGADPLARDMLFQKLRKLLHELLLNVAEHSHSRGSRVYAGVYARVRGAKPESGEEAGRWTKLFEMDKQIFGQKQFQPNPYAEWVEFFVCDAGAGLTSRIAEWHAHEDDPETKKDLKSAKSARNPLLSIAHRLFRTALSRFPRHDSNRTAVTGLQHLGHLLSHGGDYCRLYSQRGTWIGGHYPWGEKVQGSRQDITKKPEYKDLVPVSGTAYAFCIQPSHRSIEYGEDVWIEPDSRGRAAIVMALRTRLQFEPPIATEWYDRCTEQHCAPPELSQVPADSPEVLVLRPPRLVSKQDISKWLSLVAGDIGKPAKRPVNAFILAGLTPFQTLAFRELLRNVRVHPASRLDLYLVSEHWAVSCLSTLPKSLRFRAVPDKACRFLDPVDSEGEFSVADLAVLLRQADSELFWSSGITQPFFRDAPVEWVNGQGDIELILKRYLDLPHALADPQRYEACCRALKRLIELFPGHEPVAGDDLVSTLLKDAQMGAYGLAGDTPRRRDRGGIGSLSVV